MSAATAAPARPTVRVRPVPGSRAAATEVVQWLAPAPLWGDAPLGAGGAPTQPWIAELTSDDFVADLLGTLAGANGVSPADLAATKPAAATGKDGPYRLFQPLSQRYYTVCASLVCQRPGIPDHAVRPAKGQKTSFVLRRTAPDGGELAWIPKPASGGTSGGPAAGSWVAATASALVAGEEEYPMHPAPVGAFAAAGSTAAMLGMQAGSASTRTVHYGYIPVSRREKLVPAMSDAEALAKLAEFNATATVKAKPIMDDLLVRVIRPWDALSKAPSPVATLTYPSLYLILDLADWLATYVSSLHKAICDEQQMPAGSKRRALQDALAAIKVAKVPAGQPATSVPLTKAIDELAGFAPLVTGADVDGPADTYDLHASILPVPDFVTSLTNVAALYRLAEDALAEQPDPKAATVPPELSGMIKDDPAYVAPGSPQASYVIRTVFHHDPCQPVLSAATHPFTMARATDTDAPARKIRIQLPDVSNLRSAKRGVALEMPPSLQKLVNRVTPDMLQGKGLAGDSGFELGMICAFSIQIIFLCAFVVMFIFLLLLNIVFWWLPFLKICFPIPVKSAKPKAPAP